MHHIHKVKQENGWKRAGIVEVQETSNHQIVTVTVPGFFLFYFFFFPLSFFSYHSTLYLIAEKLVFNYITDLAQ